MKKVFKKKAKEDELEELPPSPNSLRKANITLISQKLFWKIIAKRHKKKKDHLKIENDTISEEIKKREINFLDFNFQAKEFFRCPRSKRRIRTKIVPNTINQNSFINKPLIHETSDSSLKENDPSSKNQLAKEEKYVSGNPECDMINIEQDWIEKGLEINQNNFYDERNLIPQTFRDEFQSQI